MTIKQQHQFCSNCNQIMPANKDIPNHIMHAVLSLMTVGWWLIIWIFLILKTNKNQFHCVKCGNDSLKTSWDTKTFLLVGLTPIALLLLSTIIYVISQITKQFF